MKTIIIVVGLPGAGKSAVADIFKGKGIPMFRTGDVFRSEALKRGLELNPRNSEMIARKLREEEGMDIAARRVGEKIKTLKEDLVCVEGPRDMYEIDYFATLGNVIILIVEAPEDVRFERSRKRISSKLSPASRNPKTLHDLKWRDQKELERGVKDILETNKYPKETIENTGTINDLKKKVEKFLKQLQAEQKQKPP